jgi:hypothetical protein
MRLIAFLLMVGALLPGPVRAVDTTVMHRKSVGACGDFCRYSDARLQRCESSERPIYDDQGKCSCKQDTTCASR